MSGRTAASLNHFSLLLILAFVLGTFGSALSAAQAYAAGGSAKGTLKIKDKTLDLKYAYLVKGPDMFDTSKTVSTVILTPNDIGQKIAECKTASCATGLTEGMTVGREDLGGTVRVIYWVVTNDGMMQYSGNDDLSALALTTDTADKMAGKLTVDDSAADGPKIDVEFDAPLAKEFKE